MTQGRGRRKPTALSAKSTRRTRPATRPRREPIEAPVGVGEVLRTLKTTTKLGRRLLEAQIWERWPEVAGRTLCTHGHPHSVRGRKLYIEAYSTVWMNRFMYQREEIVERIRKLTGVKWIDEVFILLERERPRRKSQDAG
jgi:predicted nucleic acid-binding Zn ribbon protein